MYKHKDTLTILKKGRVGKPTVKTVVFCCEKMEEFFLMADSKQRKHVGIFEEKGKAMKLLFLGVEKQAYQGKWKRCFG